MVENDTAGNVSVDNPPGFHESVSAGKVRTGYPLTAEQRERYLNAMAKRHERKRAERAAAATNETTEAPVSIEGTEAPVLVDDLASPVKPRRVRRTKQQIAAAAAAAKVGGNPLGPLDPLDPVLLEAVESQPVVMPVKVKEPPRSEELPTPSVHGGGIPWYLVAVGVVGAVSLAVLMLRGLGGGGGPGAATGPGVTDPPPAGLKGGVNNGRHTKRFFE